MDTKSLGVLIKIFLPAGGADGVWVVEKSNWVGKALAASRTRYGDLKAREDFKGSGVYVLVGPSESGLYTNRVYVGETDDLPKRLNLQNREKEFWNRVIVFTSIDGTLNKANIRYLEARLLELAKAANRAEIDNDKESTLPLLGEAARDVAEAFLQDMLLIYPVLDLEAFRMAEEEQSRSVRLYLSGKNTKAEGTETANGFVVYAGALGRAGEAGAMSPSYARLRATLIEEGLLIEQGDHLCLTEDFEFNSSSAAATVMLGVNANGMIVWKTADGETQKELQESRAESATGS